MMFNKIKRLAITCYNSNEKMDIILDFLIDNNLKINNIVNYISPILDYTELDDTERKSLNELYDFVYEKIAYREKK